MPARNVPAPVEGTAKPLEVTFQQDLARRTVAKLRDHDLLSSVMSDEDHDIAQTILNEAFREANCDVSLFRCDLMDLAGNIRLRGYDAKGEATLVPVEALPPVGAIINWAGLTYYIAEHANATS